MYSWNQTSNIPTKNYICGYCSADVAPQIGYVGNLIGGPVMGIAKTHIYICHKCQKPTFFDVNRDGTFRQIPSPSGFGKVEGISDAKVEALYQEAQKSYGAEAYTASVMCCRKLLMSVAVSLGAKEKLKFVQYVKFFKDNHYIPVLAEGWVDKIRDVGNDANHEIEIIKKDTANTVLSFTEMLLKLVYELPSRAQKMSPKTVVKTG